MERFDRGEKLTADEHRTVMDILEQQSAIDQKENEEVPLLVATEVQMEPLAKVSSDNSRKSHEEQVSGKKFKSYEFDDSELFVEPATHAKQDPIPPQPTTPIKEEILDEPDINPIASEPRRTQTEKSLKSQLKKQKKANRTPKTSGPKPKRK